MEAVFVDDLDQWADVKKITEEFLESPHASRIGFKIQEVKYYFIRALALPHLYGILLVYDEGEPVTIAILQQIVGVKECKDQPRAFILGAYNQPAPFRKQLARSDLGFTKIQEWAKERGHDMILANVREGASFAALEKRYGFKPAHMVICHKLVD